jgi:hypothetical protein
MTVQWKIVGRPGYMGDARDRLHAEWDQQYGAGNWRLAWEFGDTILEKSMAIQVYEDAYYQHLDSGNGDLEWLRDTASDVYDTDPSNVNSGFDYSIQETPNNHIHDIAIRRALTRLSWVFEGDHLVHVRWKDSEGYRLNPGIVRFHEDGLISKEFKENVSGKNIWWERFTIEDFYQRNKVLQIKV